MNLSDKSGGFAADVADDQKGATGDEQVAKPGGLGEEGAVQHASGQEGEDTRGQRAVPIHAKHCACMTNDIAISNVPKGAAQPEENKDRQKVNRAENPDHLEAVNEKRRNRRRRHSQDPDVAEGFVQFPPCFRGEYEGTQCQRETRRKSVDFNCAGCIKDGIDGHWTPRGKLHNSCLDFRISICEFECVE